MGDFNLTEEVSRLESKYRELASAGDLDFSIYVKIIQELKDKLITGRQDPGGGEPLGDLPHTLYVFGVMMELVYSQPLTLSQKKVGLTTSILHDIGYAILTAEGADIRDFQGAFVRPAHMWAGASYTPILLNQPEFRAHYSNEEILRVAQIIAVHDNPSTPYVGIDGNFKKGLPLDLSDVVGYMHREADRMWMISPGGIEVDVHRSKKPAQEQAKHVEKRYREEKQLYVDDGKFLDGLLFRTPKALEIYQANLALVNN